MGQHRGIAHAVVLSPQSRPVSPTSAHPCPDVPYATACGIRLHAFCATIPFSQELAPNAVYQPNWMAASENVGLLPLLPVGGANHCMSLSSYTVKDTLALRALLYPRQLVVLCLNFSGFLLSSALISDVHLIAVCRFV